MTCCRPQELHLEPNCEPGDMAGGPAEAADDVVVPGLVLGGCFCLRCVKCYVTIELNR